MAESITSDALNFRKALGAFTTGVTVVTTRGEDGDVGLTANSFNSVSLDPPMILWSLAKSAHSLLAFKNAEYFAVHILSADQETISNQFARGGADKFSGIDLARGPGEIPLLQHCSARFICKTAFQYEGGDHLIFVGEVEDFDHWDCAPLLFHAGKYGKIHKPQHISDSAAAKAAEGYTLGHLLRLSAHQIFRPLRVELAKHKLSLAQYTFLALAARTSQATVEELLQTLDKGDNALGPDEVAALNSQGLVTVTGGIVALSAEGTRLHMELASFYKNAESETLKQLDFDLRQTVSIGLLEIIAKTQDQP